MSNEVVTELSIAELDALVALAPLFWQEGKLPGTFDPEVVKQTWSVLIGMGIGHVLALDDKSGVLGFTITPDPNDGALTATELFWFVRPDARGRGFRLLHAFEERAATLGARRLIMAHLTGLHAPELRRVYERRGYREIETHYLKEVA